MYDPYNRYGQQSNKAGYYPNQSQNTDIYGNPLIHPTQLNHEKASILKEVEQNFNVKTLQNQMIGNQKCEILNINLPINNELSIPLEMYASK